MTKEERARVAWLREEYPAGTRIVLDHMEDPYPVPDGTKGTVHSVDAVGNVNCQFDDGRYIGLCIEVDSFHKIHEQEEDLEPKMSM